MKRYCFIFISTLMYLTSLHAATLVELSKQKTELLQSFFNNPMTLKSNSAISLKTEKTEVDAYGITHVSLKEFFGNYPVWGTEIKIHTPQNGRARRLLLNSNSKINGLFYTDLKADLLDVSFITQNQKQQALQIAEEDYLSKQKTVSAFKDELVKTIIYVTPDKKAHYAFYVSFFSDNNQSGAHRPIYILDANNFSIYKSWDNIQTEVMPVMSYGGNPVLGKILYDGIHHPALQMDIQGAVFHRAFFENDGVEIKDVAYRSEVQFVFAHYPDSEHYDMHWFDEALAEYDNINGAFSPSSDTLYGVNLTQDLYQSWFKLPILKNPDHTAKKINFYIHYGRNYSNSYWDPERQEFTQGDGDSDHYPFSTLDVVSHELSHAFTSQHSDLIYNQESGGMNEAFSDMASVAAKYYANNNSVTPEIWQLGIGLRKNGLPARYMDEPTRDGISLDHYSQYEEGIEVHRSSGIYRKVFYLLATRPSWDIQKAFSAMVLANQYFWTPNSTFTQGACGVMSAAEELNLSTADVKIAFKQVGINLNDC